MYLNLLNSEEKELFLDLCINLSESDGEFCQVEKNTITQFCEEMNINNRFYASCNIDEALDRLNKLCDDKERRVVAIEVIGVILADNNFSESEKDILIKLSEIFNITYSEIENLIQVVKSLYDIYKKFNLFLNRENIQE